MWLIQPSEDYRDSTTVSADIAALYTATGNKLAFLSVDSQAVTTTSQKTLVVDRHSEVRFEPRSLRNFNDDQIDLSQFGFNAISDGDFNNIVGSLRDDAALLEQLLLEYRDNTDSERASRLAQILAKFDHSGITDLGQELVFSGDAMSQRAGLDLLGGQQATNAEARDIIVQMLADETNPDILTAALNALAKPSVSDPEQLQRVLDQLVLHASDQDPIVRRHSLSLMSRWGGDVDMNDYFIHGLMDADQRVRARAVFSLTESNHPGDIVRQALISVVENGDEIERIRKNALLALDRYDLNADDRQRYSSML